MCETETNDCLSHVFRASLKSGYHNWKLGEITQRSAKQPQLVYVRYRDHVLYHYGEPLFQKPQTRECVGWLVYDCADYVIICWDRDANPPTLKNGDAKASGLVLLHESVLELRKIV